MPPVDSLLAECPSSVANPWFVLPVRLRLLLPMVLAVAHVAADATAETLRPVVRDLGPIADTAERTVEFILPGAPEGGLRILDVRTPCGCTVPSFASRQYAAGERASIIVSFDASAVGRYGEVRRELWVLTNAQGWSPVRLVLTALIHPTGAQILALPAVVDIGNVGPGAVLGGEFDIHILDLDIQPITVEVLSDDLSSKLSPPDGAEGQWHVTLDGLAPQQPGRFQIPIRIRGSDGSEVGGSWIHGQVMAPVRIEPRRVYFGVLPQGSAAERKVRVFGSKGQPPSIKRVEVSDSQVNGEFVADSGGVTGYLRFELPEKTPPGRFVAHCLVEFEDPALPNLNIPLYWTRSASRAEEGQRIIRGFPNEPELTTEENGEMVHRRQWESQETLRPREGDPQMYP